MKTRQVTDDSGCYSEKRFSLSTVLYTSLWKMSFVLNHILPVRLSFYFHFSVKVYRLQYELGRFFNNVVQKRVFFLRRVFVFIKFYRYQTIENLSGNFFMFFYYLWSILYFKLGLVSYKTYKLFVWSCYVNVSVKFISFLFYYVRTEWLNLYLCKWSYYIEPRQNFTLCAFFHASLKEEKIVTHSVRKYDWSMQFLLIKIWAQRQKKFQDLFLMFSYLSLKQRKILTSPNKIELKVFSV